jgi:hypothetical protein
MFWIIFGILILILIILLLILYFIKIKEPKENIVFKEAENNHYGGINTPVNLNKAIDQYELSIKTEETSIEKGKAYMSLGRLFQEGSKTQVPDAEKSIENYLKALEYGYEEAIWNIAELYMNGLHPFYLPEKLSAAKIYNIIIYEDKFSDNIKNASKVANKEANKLAYNDLDSIADKDRVYKELPYGITSKLYNIIKNYDGYHFEVPYNKFTPIKINDHVEDNDRRINRTEDRDDFQEALLNDAIWNFNVTPERPIYNDSQNVHSSSVNNIALEKLEQINNETSINNDFRQNSSQFMSELNRINMSSEEKENANKILDSLKDLKHSKFDKSETEIFNTVWSRINDPINRNNREDMIKVLGQNLASGLEHNYTVCSTGKVMRIIGSLDAMDNGRLPDLKPEWAFKDEISNSASKVREEILNSANESDRRRYETDENIELSNKMKERFIEKCKKDYDGILNSYELDNMIKDYTENF